MIEKKESVAQSIGRVKRSKSLDSRIVDLLSSKAVEIVFSDKKVTYLVNLPRKGTGMVISGDTIRHYPTFYDALCSLL